MSNNACHRFFFCYALVSYRTNPDITPLFVTLRLRYAQKIRKLKKRNYLYKLFGGVIEVSYLCTVK